MNHYRKVVYYQNVEINSFVCKLAQSCTVKLILVCDNYFKALLHFFIKTIIKMKLCWVIVLLGTELVQHLPDIEHHSDNQCTHAQVPGSSSPLHGPSSPVTALHTGKPLKPLFPLISSIRKLFPGCNSRLKGKR